MMNDLTLISIVIVTYNSKYLIDRCLKPITGRDELQVVIVDNCSNDGTAEYVEETWSAVEVIRAPSNLGFAGGNNLGFTKCNHEIIVMLNPDAFLDDPQQLQILAATLLQSPRAAIIGPQLLNVDGSHQVGDAGWADSLCATLGHFLFVHRLIPGFPATYLTNPALLSGGPIQLDWICGACLMVRRDVINRIGGLDERIFMYGEDVEWGERARSAGYDVLYLPEVRVLHAQGAVGTEGKVSTAWLRQRLMKFQQRGWMHVVVFRAITLTGFSIRYAVLLAQGLRKDTEYRKKAIRAFMCFLTGRNGK